MAPVTRQSKAKIAIEKTSKMGRTEGKARRKEKRTATEPAPPPPVSTVPIQSAPSTVPPSPSQLDANLVPTTGVSEMGKEARIDSDFLLKSVGGLDSTTQGESNVNIEGENVGAPVTDTVPPVVNVPLQGNNASDSEETGEDTNDGSESSKPAPPLRSYGKDTQPVVSSVVPRKRSREGDDDADYRPPEERATGQSSKNPRASTGRRTNESSHPEETTFEEIGAHLALEFRFYTSEAKDYHRSNVSRKGFHYEVKFNPSTLLAAAHWGDYLIQRNLMAWSSKFSECNINLVREFYANLSPSFADPGSVWFGKVFVRGKIISINPSVLCRVLELPSQQFDGVFPDDAQFHEPSVVQTLTQGKQSAFTSGKLISTDLSLECFLCFKFCSSCVVPSKNHTYISRNMAHLVYAVEKQMPINFPKIIMTQLAARARMTNPSRIELAYPALLTSILESAGIERNPQDVIENVNTFLLTDKISKKVFYVRAKRMIKECLEEFDVLAKKLLELSAAIKANQEKRARAIALLPDSWSDNEGDRVGPSDASGGGRFVLKFV